MVNFLQHRQQATNSSEERRMLQIIKIHLRPSQITLERLEFAFFNKNHKRTKRQALFGISLGFGILSMGMSIYNMIQIKKLHNDINNINQGFQHVYDIIKEEDHAITQLSNSIEHIKTACKIILTVTNLEQERTTMNSNLLLLTTMINTHNSEISSWGSGLEALMFGHLYPTLVNPKRLQIAMQIITNQANSRGLTLLHEETSAIYKSDISYFSTTEKKIIILVHVPLVEKNQIDVYEHLPIPFPIDNLIHTVESNNQILATDKSGNMGLELSKTDLLHCQTESTHAGNAFICPNTNLLNNNIKNSCLGALFFGIPHQLHNCHHFVQDSTNTQDFIIQTGPTTITLLAKESKTIMMVCKNASHAMSAKGLVKMSVAEGCSILTETHTFNPQVILDMESDFIERQLKIKADLIFGNDNHNDLAKAYQELARTQRPGKRHLAELRHWLVGASANNTNTAVSYGISMIAVTLSCVILSILLFLYCKYSRGKANQNAKTTI